MGLLCRCKSGGLSETWLRQPSQVTAGSEKVRLSDNARPFARWCSKFREGLQARKASIEVGTALKTMVQSENSFGEVHQKDIWMPVGAPLTEGALPQSHASTSWSPAKTAPTDQPQNAHMNLVGEFMRENVKVSLLFPLSDSALSQHTGLH